MSNVPVLDSDGVGLLESSNIDSLSNAKFNLLNN